MVLWTEGLCSPSLSSYVETPIPNVMVFGGGPFGRSWGGAPHPHGTGALQARIQVHFLDRVEAPGPSALERWRWDERGWNLAPELGPSMYIFALSWEWGAMLIPKQIFFFFLETKWIMGIFKPFHPERVSWRHQSCTFLESKLMRTQWRSLSALNPERPGGRILSRDRSSSWGN